MKKVVLLLVLVVALAVPSLRSVTAQASKIELHMTWWGSQARHDRTIKVIQQYMAANPNINITYEFANFNDYWTKLNTLAAGGSLPCIMQQDYAYVAEWANRGLLLPLDDYYKNKTIDTTNIAKTVLDSGNVNGKNYALSLGSNSQSFILDVDAFKKAGIDLPSKTWTWKDFEDIALQLHQKLGIWATANGLEDVQMWKSLYLGYGEHVFTDDGSKFGYADDQPLIDYYSMILRLQKAGAVATPAETTQYVNASPEQTAIVTGKEAIRYQWSNQVVAIFKAAGTTRHFELWPLPRPVGKASENYIKPSMFFSIPTACKTPDEAAKFIDYFTNSKEANDILGGERGVPVSSVIRDYLAPKLDPVSAATFAFLGQVEKDSSPIMPPDPTGFTDLLNNVYLPEFVQPVLYEQVPVTDGVQTLRKDAEAILAKNAQVATAAATTQK